MSEQAKQQIGDGRDSYGKAASQMAKAAKTAGKTAKAAAEGAKATANTALQTVKAGAKVGKAAANIAQGTAAGGPWGAIISAAWSLRHTLFKILIALCLVVVFLVVTILSIPSIIFDTIFDNKYDGSGGQTSIVRAFDDLSGTVDDIIELAFDSTLGRVKDIISGGGYDYSYSMNHLTYKSPTKDDYDIYYILAAYSVSMHQQGTSQENMTLKLNNVTDLMFPFTYQVRKAERKIETIIDGILSLIIEPFEYIECTISLFNNNSILQAFNLDLNAKYGEFDITYGDAIEYMATSLEKTLSEGV